MKTKCRAKKMTQQPENAKCCVESSFKCYLHCQTAQLFYSSRAPFLPPTLFCYSMAWLTTLFYYSKSPLKSPADSRNFLCSGSFDLSKLGLWITLIMIADFQSFFVHRYKKDMNNFYQRILILKNISCFMHQIFLRGQSLPGLVPEACFRAPVNLCRQCHQTVKSQTKIQTFLTRLNIIHQNLQTIYYDSSPLPPDLVKA